MKRTATFSQQPARRTRRSGWHLAAALLLALGLQACGSKDEPAPQAQGSTIQNDQRWPEFIAAHSEGPQSRSAQLQIRFVDDAITAADIGKPVAGLVTLEPAIAVDAVFTDPRNLLIAPKAPFASGTRYTLSLHADKLPALPKTLGVYQFPVDVMPQAIEISISSVTPGIGSERDQMQISGVLGTADIADADVVEKLLLARWQDQDLGITWQHAADGRQHNFTLAAVTRGEQETQVTLTADGKALGVTETQTRSIAIPARGLFALTRSSRSTDANPSIRIEFSEPLDARQNLNGLISVSNNLAHTLRINGNVLNIFPAETPTGDVTISIDAALRSSDGRTLGQSRTETVSFEQRKPQVRFVGKGSILPDGALQSIPFEAVNVHTVHVTALRVYEQNLGQFLQVNRLGDQNELPRVGRVLWRKTVRLGAGETGKWRRFAFDAKELFTGDPNALVQLSLDINRDDAVWSCSDAENAVPVPAREAPRSAEDQNEIWQSNWDYAEFEYYDGWWQDRDNPCKDIYYLRNTNARATRNVVRGNIGVIGKSAGDQTWHFATTNIRSGDVAAGVQLTLFNFQNQKIASASSDRNGLVSISSEQKPFYVLAEKSGQRGILKLNEASALPVSHFDVGGVQVERGIKGTLYGERGVWRPGDTLYLTFVLQDPQNVIPDSHPASIELINPQGQLVHTRSNNQPVGDFYAFQIPTHENDLTGTWRAVVKVGGRSFEQPVKIETIMPNRLKVELATADVLRVDDTPQLKLFSQWLHGGKANGLKADVKLRLRPMATRFENIRDYQFDDPTRRYSGEEQSVFEGTLDAEGRAEFSSEFALQSEAAGMLNALFTTRVFEPGGAFSISTQSVPYHPYSHYVGVKLPKGDAARNMLLTDTDHTVEITTVDSHGKATPRKGIDVAIYKVQWRWWWDQSGDEAASYEQRESNTLIEKGTIETVNGRGQWAFKIKYPDWGRYLLRACDSESGHCSGQFVYVDWPGWAGRAQDQSGPGANALTLSSDKPRYSVGETARIQLPPASSGRALLSIETGSKLLRQEWLPLGGTRQQFEVPITADMAPNAYVSVTLLQPHENKANDRPIRLYGVLPLLVDDPQTRLQPQITVADEVRPETSMSIAVSEQQKRAMTYTLAVVDEGLLGITNFKTPQLHDVFYKREALGVKTWDLFDEVVGAYGGALERMLALGGSDALLKRDPDGDKKRFPPVVRFVGPFQLAAGKSATHNIDLPPYVGAVRVMLIAGEKGAYGTAEKEVKVRQPLMLLATLPRVLGPDEELRVPVSVFAMDDNVRDVKLSLRTDKHLQVLDGGTAALKFSGMGDQIAFLRLKVGKQLGKASATFVVESGKERAEQTIHVDVRAPNPHTTQVEKVLVQPNASWHGEIKPHGLPGTNSVMLEASVAPAVNLGARLDYLIRYPHGCVEQTTSAAFPQLYLDKLLALDADQKQRTQRHVEQAIDRLRQFQNSNGGFSYWPGQADENSWSSSYAGHFLIEAQRLGYTVPATTLASWKAFQKARAHGAYSDQRRLDGDDLALDQAYRLYTLAVAGAPELSAMNRLRERDRLPATARYLLAAAYKQAGMADVATRLTAGAELNIVKYDRPGMTFGSDLRDQAILLDSLVGLGERGRADDMAQSVAEKLSAESWYSTQSLSWSLLALSHYLGDASFQKNFAYRVQVDKQAALQLASDRPLQQTALKNVADQGSALRIDNSNDRPLYVQLIRRGIAAAGSETVSNNTLAMNLQFVDADGKTLDVTRLRQGSDLRVRITVKNTSTLNLDNLALTSVVPSGWEIQNERLDVTDAQTGSDTGSGNSPRAGRSREQADSSYDYRDQRDDRVHTYFGLAPGVSKTFELAFTAAYPGRYYLPGWSVEAMYDAHRHAHLAGQWVEVVNAN